MEQTRLPDGQHFAKFLVLSLHFLLSQGSPRLTILNSSNYFVFEEDTESEVQFSVEDAEKDKLSYKIFINHKPVGRNISRLKCYLSKTPDACSSSSTDCECLEQTPEHVYKLKKHMQEDDGGEWIFVLNGKGMTEQTAINITVLSRGRVAINTTEVVKSRKGELESV
ncbi:uncharacterized protein LOC112568600 [Pomacea canaliculata]|uniref:uncharacterized protein LOC112568600 n=1 Tax=Pomacea canaliculata TaxID=400727 RepID=UPI000D72F4D8|nr:uncharacterized protein LOC112568600 [Pomacea canaliculata]